jgi:hypothetical protein
VAVASSAGQSAAFKASVKHFFRHLHDPRALRRNALARRFFEEALQESRPGGDRIVLARLHRLVREAAQRCRDVDVRDGKGDRALRRHAIFVRQCLEQRSVPEVAAALGISIYHCYRERAAICLRVAYLIAEQSKSPTVDQIYSLDEFRVQMDSTIRQASFGNKDAVLRCCEDLLQLAASTEQKVEVLRLFLTTALEFGQGDRAQRAYVDARRLCNESLSPGGTNEWCLTRSCVDLMESELAYYHGDVGRALSAAHRASVSLQRRLGDAPTHMRELFVHSLLVSTEILWGNGDTEKAYEHIAAAEVNLRHVRATSVALRTRVTAGFWRVRQPLLLSSRGWCPSSQRLQGLMTAFELAYGAGMLTDAADVLADLTHFHAIAGNADDALRSGRSTMLLARQSGNKNRQAKTSIAVAVDLLSTKNWRHAHALLPHREQAASYDPASLAAFSYFDVVYALKARNFVKAWELAVRGINRNVSPRSVLRHQLVAAVAGQELNRRAEARKLVEEILPGAQKLAFASVLRDAYAVAARVIGEPRFARKARELTHLIAT